MQKENYPKKEEHSRFILYKVASYTNSLREIEREKNYPPKGAPRRLYDYCTK